MLQFSVFRITIHNAHNIKCNHNSNITIVSLCHASNFSFADPLFIIILQCCFYGCRDCCLFFIWKNRIYFVRLPVLFSCVRFHFEVSSSPQWIDSAFSSTDKNCCMLVFSSMLVVLLMLFVEWLKSYISLLNDSFQWLCTQIVFICYSISFGSVCLAYGLLLFLLSFQTRFVFCMFYTIRCTINIHLILWKLVLPIFHRISLFFTSFFKNSNFNYLFTTIFIHSFLFLVVREIYHWPLMYKCCNIFISVSNSHSKKTMKNLINFFLHLNGLYKECKLY